MFKFIEPIFNPQLNAADGCKLSPCPACKSPPASDCSARQLPLLRWWPPRPRTGSRRRTSPSSAPFHSWRGWRPARRHAATPSPTSARRPSNLSRATCRPTSSNPRQFARQPDPRGRVSTAGEPANRLKVVKMRQGPDRDWLNRTTE